MAVVDGDPDIRDVVADALADQGYEVRVAGDGRAALGVLAAWRPDAIVLDLMMPEMDGWAFRAAQHALPEVPRPTAGQRDDRAGQRGGGVRRVVAPEVNAAYPGLSSRRLERP